MTPDSFDKHAVYLVLDGGLGNQMFQYAFALALAQHKKARLYLTLYRFYKNNRRNYLLGGFDLKAFVILEKFFSPFPYTFEPHYHYWHGWRDVALPCRLLGYWQSERYFQDIKEQIHTIFALNRFRNHENTDIFRQIQQAEHSVGVHIRRGDYLVKKHLQHHGIMCADYYEKARTLIEARYPQATFFIFSDEPKRAYQELGHWSRTHFVVHNNNPYQEMMLLSACHHQIIANSSFSWWAAWLNRYPDKKVIAPHQWFLDKTLDTTDLIPSGWLKL
ncbi:MAG: alpha-1,2-fucosyltransferase [Alphaproteobacteria bacterium GM202ARS2]|nr:alpha-1,2-fucosyltransferase [Alphaproteobacteria bacterium GM202ARS2]